jgi:hypothetical protein
MKVFRAATDSDNDLAPPRRRRHTHSSWQVLADLMMLLYQAAIVMLSLLLIVSQIAAKNSVGDDHPHAEYIITLEWPDNRDVDLDLWMRDEENHVIYYGAREAPNESLDRDSQGFVTNRTILKDGKVTYSPNREIISLRMVAPGDYLFAVSYYNGHPAESSRVYDADDPTAAIDAKVTVGKVNPVLTTVAHADVHFDHPKEANNALYIHIGDDGTVTTLPLPADNLVYEHGGAHP